MADLGQNKVPFVMSYVIWFVLKMLISGVRKLRNLMVCMNYKDILPTTVYMLMHRGSSH